MEISTKDMHKKVEALSHSQIAKICNLSFEENDMEIEMLYVANLLQRGELDQAKEYFHSFNKDYAKELLNTTSYHTHFGTLLHVLLYWNHSEEAFELYKYFISKGAVPKEDYYGDIPWEQKGTIYVPMKQGNVQYKRVINKFLTINEKVSDFQAAVST